MLSITSLEAIDQERKDHVLAEISVLKGELDDKTKSIKEKQDKMQEK